MFHRSNRKRKPLFACRLLALGFLAFVLAGAAGSRPAQAGTELLMVEQAHCEWCAAWNAEIGGVYHLTEEGKRAPLRRQDLFDSWPPDITIKGQVHFTPTFILLVDGKEVGRIEGYPGEHFFWPLLAQLLNRTPTETNVRENPAKEGNGS